MGKRKEQLNLLCDIGDLAALLSESVDIEIFLQRTVSLVAGNLSADVCSVYLYDEQADELVLRATMGLNSEAVGKVRMKLGEGLVGITLERLQPICEGTATMSPYYRYFEEAHEDRFQSFLAVPIRRGVEKIGVLVVQKEQKNYFDEYDVMTLRATASQLAGAMENAKLLIGMNQPKGKKSDRPAEYKGVRFIKGKSASGGYAYADAAVMRESHGGLMTGYDESENGTTFTLKDFFVALEKTTQQLESLQAKLSQRLPESASLIFTAHFMILKDAKFIDKIVGLIEKGTPAPEAIRKVAGDYMRIFLSSPHAYIREKGNDMEDLAGRILKNLLYATADEIGNERGRIIIALDLFPSEMLKLATEDVKGIILVSGGVTSHVAILSRSMKIPLIIAEHRDLLEIPDGAPIILDADIGNIFICPSEKIVDQYETRNRTSQAVAPLKSRLADETMTRDGKRVRLMANINLLSELTLARDLNAEGIGLYRTEFPFLIRNNFPSEQEQYVVYKQLFEVMKGKEVTLRTLDVGGDKVLAYMDSGAEANPELGLRSIRFFPPPPGNLRTANPRDSSRRPSGTGPPDHVPHDLVRGRIPRGPPDGGREHGRFGKRRPPPPSETVRGDHAGNSLRGGNHERTGQGGRFLLHRHQRLRPIHAGRGPHQRKGGQLLPAVSSLDPAGHGAHGPLGQHLGKGNIGMRRNGPRTRIHPVSPGNRNPHPERGSPVSPERAGAYFQIENERRGKVRQGTARTADCQGRLERASAVSGIAAVGCYLLANIQQLSGGQWQASIQFAGRSQ